MYNTAGVDLVKGKIGLSKVLTQGKQPLFFPVSKTIIYALAKRMAAQPETSSPHLPYGSEIKSRPMGAERSGIYIFQFIPNLSTVCSPWTSSIWAPN